MILEQQPNDPGTETPDYSVPWKPVDNWIGVLLLAMINGVLLFAVGRGVGVKLAQNVGIILVELVYLLPVVVIFGWRRISWKYLGFRKFDWSSLGLGCGLMIGGYLIILVHNVVLTLLGVNTQGQTIIKAFNSLDTPVWFIMVGIVVAPIVEEAFFRGFLFQGFRQKYGWVRSMLLSSAIFALAHLDPASLIPTFILGCVLAYVYHRSNSLWPGVVLHFAVNAFGLCSAYALTQFPGIIPS